MVARALWSGLFVASVLALSLATTAGEENPPQRDAEAAAQPAAEPQPAEAAAQPAAEPQASAEPPSDAESPLSFTRDVLPILRDHCQGCHQPALAKGRYVMTSFDRLLAGGESGDAAIVPGKPDESQLVELITPVDGKAEMPREKPPLSETQIAVIRRWIDEGANDDTPAVERLVDADHPPVYELPPVITSLDFSPDGSLLAVSGYHEVLLHTADGSQLVARLVGLSERIEQAVFSPDGKRLAVTGGQPGRLGEVQIWEVESRKLALSVPVSHDTLYGACWSPDGRLIAFGCPDNTVRVVDAQTAEQVFFNGAHEDWPLGTAFSVEGDHLVSVSRDRSMKLFEVATQRFIDNVTSITPGALRGGLASVDRHPTKDELLCGGADGEPKIYRMHRTMARKIGDDYNLIRKMSALPGRVYAVRYSRDGTRVVAGSSQDGRGEVRVYNESDGKPIATMEQVESGVYAVAFRPDGEVVASAGFDGWVRLHTAADGKLIHKFMPVPIGK
jgi:WD40 repeat protein